MTVTSIGRGGRCQRRLRNLQQDVDNNFATIC